MSAHRSSASVLALLFAALIGYASLYPFTGWRQPGVEWLGFLTAPWSVWWTWFDLLANLVGYMPLGALVFGALVRTGTRRRWAWFWALAAGATLSFSLEFLQNFLPLRVASNVDLGLNMAGSLAGALLGWLIHTLGAVERWQAARDRWFLEHSAGGLALLFMWPVALLLPLPAPLGVGQVLPWLQEVLSEAVQDTFAAPWAASWLPALEPTQLSLWGESSLIALGLLAPCLVAFVVTRPGWRRVALVMGLAFLGALATTLSTALNFGPQHALAWSTPQVLAAMAGGAVLALALSPVPSRVAATLGSVALLALVVLVIQAPPDPYFSESLQAWEQGQFVRFHGAVRWVGLLWPWAAMLYLQVGWRS
jgi:VanZ family protein